MKSTWTNFLTKYSSHFCPKWISHHHRQHCTTSLGFNGNHSPPENSYKNSSNFTNQDISWYHSYLESSNHILSIVKAEYSFDNFYIFTHLFHLIPYQAIIGFLSFVTTAICGRQTIDCFDFSIFANNKLFTLSTTLNPPLLFCCTFNITLSDCLNAYLPYHMTFWKTILFIQRCISMTHVTRAVGSEVRCRSLNPKVWSSTMSISCVSEQEA